MRVELTTNVDTGQSLRYNNQMIYQAISRKELGYVSIAMLVSSC